MAATIHWLQEGGNPIVNDDKGWCQWPAHPMAPLSCAAEYGYPEIDHCWNGETAGHRGFGTKANSRILHFEDPKETIYCRPNCLVDRPRICEDEDGCPKIYLGAEGWNNQVGVWDYYCRDMRPTLKVGDCIATHLIPAAEKFEYFTWGVGKAAPGVTGKFKLMCGGIDLSPTIDMGVQATKIGCTDIPAENQFADLCDGFDVVLFEIESMPDDVEGDNCKKEKGKLDGLSFMGSALMRTVCTGK